MTYNPDGRIKRISRGVMLNPGSCVACNNSSGDTYADLGIFVDLFGNLYLCESCSNGASEVFGGLRPVNEAGLREHIASLEASCNKLTEENEQLGKLNESLRTSFDDLSRRYWRDDDAPPGEDATEADVRAEQTPRIINAEPIRDPEPAEQDDASFLGDLDPELTENDEGDADDPLAELRKTLASEPGSISEPAPVERPNGSATVGRLFGE